MSESKWSPSTSETISFCSSTTAFPENSINHSQIIRFTSSRLNYAAAASCIEARMETIHELQTEEKWKEIWEEAVVPATKIGIAVANLPT